MLPKYAFKHRNLPESERYIWIFQNVHGKSRFVYIIGSRATRHSAVSPLRRQSSISSAASHLCLWDIAAACLAVNFFCRQNRFAETHRHLQLSYHITDRLLTAGNNIKRSFFKEKVKSEFYWNTTECWLNGTECRLNGHWIVSAVQSTESWLKGHWMASFSFIGTEWFWSAWR